MVLKQPAHAIACINICVHIIIPSIDSPITVWTLQLVQKRQHTVVNPQRWNLAIEVAGKLEKKNVNLCHPSPADRSTTSTKRGMQKKKKEVSYSPGPVCAVLLLMLQFLLHLFFLQEKRRCSPTLCLLQCTGTPKMTLIPMRKCGT